MEAAIPEPIHCLVVGAGPAGLTAALYLRRYLRRVVVADQGHSRALAIERAHNYPGFPGGITGRELLQRLRDQLDGVNGSVIEAEVRSLTRNDDGQWPGFVAQLGQHVVRASTVLLATGVVDAVPAVPGIPLVRRHGLLRQCPICDGHEHRGQRIAVLGDGANAWREAGFIAHFSPHVSVVGLRAPPERGDEPDDPGRPQADAPDRPPAGENEEPSGGHAFPREPAPARLPSPVERVDLGPEGGVHVVLRDGSQHHFDVLYAALGCTPRAELGRALGARCDEHGNLMVDVHCATSVPGLYAAGDVVSALDQLTVAVGHGAIAATAIHNHLKLPRATPRSVPVTQV